MRAVIFLIIFISATTKAAPLKTIQTFYAESKNLYTQAEKEKSFAKKTDYLKNLKKSFDKELALYQKNNPQKGSNEEHEISRLFFTLDPVFELADKKNISATECQHARAAIGPVDAKETPESTRLARTQEALRWLELICK